MAGTATNLDSTKITTGKGLLWSGMGIPAVGSRTVLHTDGTPDSTANPNARNIGLTKEGNKVTIKHTSSSQEADELKSPYREIIASEDISVAGSMLQLEDLVTLKAFLPTGTYAAASGYEEFAFGGLTTIPSVAKPCIALIWVLVSDSTKWAVVTVYQATNIEGIEFQITKTTDAFSPYSFKGQAISSRTAGDQTAKYYKQA